ncbi:MAG: beta-N-acetylhexosaminidase [Bacteroidota bacterium]|nr:beta-N-acetylhexosaminidase [Bacteroidota bacterium]
MRNFKYLLISIFISMSCASKAHDLGIIPKPVKTEVKQGYFNFTADINIIFKSNNLQNIANILSKELSGNYNIDSKIVESVDSKSYIKLELLKKDNFGKEAYELAINKDDILISASTSNGVFNGVQSLLQIFYLNMGNEYSKIPQLQIFDKPEYSWRGMHLDVCRHFFDKEFVKKYLDIMAMYKMNTFHWHLTEDQAWRIEIKKYPKLTEIGAYRNETMVGKNWEKFDGKKHGGYYSQDDIREIVKYASERYIRVVPEIEMPGHARAALAAYPELGCSGGPYEVAKTWGVFKDVYCAGNENTFQFLEEVIDEVIELFPGEYIHIGGDECPKDMWKVCKKCQKRMSDKGLNDEHELQSYFIKRIEKYINSKNKKIIGWDEILEGGLAPNATVMSWRGVKGGIKAAKMNHDVIMTPNSHCYFDHYQAKPENEPLAIGGFTPLKKVYNYNPKPESLSKSEAEHILGAQANVWTEYIATTEQLEYMILPRMCALAEVVWSANDNKNWDDFKNRIEQHEEIFKQKGYNFRDID